MTELLELGKALVKHYVIMLKKVVFLFVCFFFLGGGGSFLQCKEKKNAIWLSPMAKTPI